MRSIFTWIGIIAMVGCAGAAESPAAIPDKPTADQVLAALKARGDSLQDLSVDVKLTNVDVTTADSNTNVGTMVLKKDANGDTRIHIVFTAKIEGDRKYPVHHEYALTDGWLRERDYDLKKETDRQVAQPGQKINLLKLGDGPFPLPIGQDPDEVKKQFDVSEPAAGKDDPAGTVHLRLVPKKASEFERRFKQIDIWASKSDGMPVKIGTVDRNGDTMQTTEFNNVKVNQGVKDEEFVLPEVRGWSVDQEPYGG